MATRPIFDHFWKKCIFPFEKPKTKKNQIIGVGHAKCQAHNTLYVCQGPEPPNSILEKTLVSRNDFQDIWNKKIKK